MWAGEGFRFASFQDVRVDGRLVDVFQVVGDAPGRYPRWEMDFPQAGSGYIDLDLVGLDVSRWALCTWKYPTAPLLAVVTPNAGSGLFHITSTCKNPGRPGDVVDSVDLAASSDRVDVRNCVAVSLRAAEEADVSDNQSCITITRSP